jgi:DNA-binding MarR family transcriptional regulator
VGLTNQQSSLLMALNRPEPPSMGPVAELPAMDRTTLTAALKPLERRGLLRVEPSPTDGRARILVLTTAGRETPAVSIWQETHAAVEERLVGLELDALRTALTLLAGVSRS